MRSDVNAALSSLYLELAGELAADVNGIVRNHIAELEAERDRLRDAGRAMLIECAKLTAERDRLVEACEDLRISRVAWEREAYRLRAERDRLRDEADRLKVLLSETQSTSFPHVPKWFSMAVSSILDQEATDA